MNGLQIFPDVDPDGTCDPYVAMRWCVTPELTEMLKKDAKSGLTHEPLLLISIRSMNGDKYVKETRRYLVPLKQELQHVSFAYPGKNSVTAMVVIGKFKSARYVFLNHGDNYNRYNTRYHNYIYESLMSYETGQKEMQQQSIVGQHQADHRGKSFVYASITPAMDEKIVDVPKEMFAKEPSQFYKDYTAKFSMKKPIDECSMRRRIIATTPLMPFVFGIGMVARLFQAIVGTVLLMFPMDFSGFRHPNTTHFSDVWATAHRPFWWYRVQKKSNGTEKHVPQNIFLLIFNPINILVLSLIIFGFTSLPWHWVPGKKVPLLKHGEPVLDKHHHVIMVRTGHHTHIAHMGFLQCLWLVSLVLAGLVVICAFVMGMTLIAEWIDRKVHPRRGTAKSPKKTNRLAKRFDEYKQKKKQQRLEQQIEASKRYYAELGQMACNGNAAKAELDALPKHKRTIKLRYQATKKKVCRPFVN